jgi:hypothetical protein
MLILSVVLLLLCSCGGSSGGGMAPPSGPPPTNPAALPITVANAQDITVTVLEAITSSVEIVDIVDVIGLPAIGGTNPDLTKLATSKLFADVIACDTGQATVTWNDADNDLMISTGDTFDVLFEMCFFEDPGATLDGATSFTDIIVTGDPFFQIAPWRLAMTFGFDNLSGVDSEGTAILDGSLDLDLSSEDNLVVNLSIATDSLTVEQSGISETLSDYVLTETLDLNTSTQVISANGTLTSTLLEGSVTFETLQDFVAIGEENPFTGQLLISDSSSSVLVTALDNLSVQLDIDLDLDGTIDETIVVTWDELDID